MKAALPRVAEAALVAAGGGALGLVAGALVAGPAGAIVGAALAGLNGLAAGARGIYDWRSARGWLAFAADSTWGLVMTSLGVVLALANGLVPAARHEVELSRRQNRQIFDGGLALQRRMALTLGNVTSNANPSGRGLNPLFLKRHEELHIWQARVFGPLFPLVYVVWGAVGAAVGFCVWLAHRDESLHALVQTAAYFDNPFEYWAYRNDRNWPPAGAHPLLAWPPAATGTTPVEAPSRRTRVLVAALGLALVFATALAVRLAYRADRAAAFDQIMPSQSFIAHRRAVRMLEGKGVLFWEDADPDLLRQIRRPPGYAAFLAGVYLFTGPDLKRAQLAQIGIDALAAVGLALLAGWLVAPRAGLAAGLLYALSPHLAVFSTIVTPDAVASWPVLAGGAAFLVALRRGGRRSAFVLAAAGGVSIGLSCWLTAQGLNLPFVLLAAGVVTARRGERRRALALGAALVAGTLVAVGPLTIRNVSVYGALVPVRPGLGVTLVEGLGVYDASLPATDGALLADEAARSGRPEYGKALYAPDGLERERERVGRALAAIRARPLLFVGAMIDRVGLMLTYDFEGEGGWPRDTAYVGAVAGGGPVRAVLRGLQRLVFRTWLVWLLILAGAAALVWRGRWRTAVLLAAVPVHHCLLQSLLLTEYKYTLPVHAWLFAIAASALLFNRSVPGAVATGSTAGR